MNTLKLIMKMIKEKEVKREQIGGDHYKDRAIQPIDYIMENNLGFCEGNVVKYITRHQYKNGIEDLLKAKQYIDFILESQYNFKP